MSEKPKKGVRRPSPHAVIDLSDRTEYRSVPADEAPLTGILLEMEASGRPLKRKPGQPVAHVILALDLSASMNAPTKFPVLQRAVGSMLDDLQRKGAADVLVSVVVFSMGSDTLIKAVPARRIGKQPFFRALESNKLCFGRYTDVSGALSRAGRIAYDQAKVDPTLPIRVYLMTDGRPQDMPRAMDSMEMLAKVRCDVHALAFGADADVVALQSLFSGRRGGTVKSVRSETIGSAFERVAEVAQRVVATRCQIEIELASGVVGGQVFRYRPARVRYPAPAFEGGKLFTADLGTLETARTYQLFFQVRPPERNETMTHLGEVRVSIPGAGGPITSTLRLELPRTPAETRTGEFRKDVRTARDILQALDASNPQAALRALRLRKTLYSHEKRDPGLIALIDKAVHLLESTRSLDGLSPGEFATLQAHTCTSGVQADLAVLGG